MKFKLLRTVFKTVLLGIPVLLLLAILLAAWAVRRAWPQEEGKIVVQGLSAPVEVVRDRWGIPHLYAANEHDLFFAQGFVHAQDRLWPMFFNRVVGSGRLSELFGPGTLPTDLYLRTLGLRRLAARDLARLTPETRGFLEAYSSGVNAFLATHQGRLPVELRILGVEAERWTALDTLTWTRMMGLNLSQNSGFELTRSRLVPKLGAEAVRRLIPPYPGDAPLIVPSPGVPGMTGSPRRLAPLAGLLPRADGERWASNGWVVHGSRTATGKPLLANDTHLGLGMPSVWYEIGLHGGRFDVAGFSFPGMPFVVIGQNQRIAWGITNLNADVQDVYLEKLDNPERPTAAMFRGRWEKLTRTTERIPVKGAEPEVHEVLETRHGPLIHKVQPDWQGAPPMALAWAASDGSRMMDALALLGRAGSWPEFRGALSHWDTPSLNFVYADVDGHIGYQSTARVPRRSPGHDGSVPVAGWDGRAEWQGTIPFAEMPHVLDPPAGFIVTANNRVVGDDYPYTLAVDWAPADRARRLAALLAAEPRLTPERARAIQNDTHWAQAGTLRPVLLAVRPQGELETAALDRLRAWDSRFDADSVGASVFAVWMRWLRPAIFADDLGPELAPVAEGLIYGQSDALTALLTRPRDPLFARLLDDQGTPAVETRDDILRRSFSQAVAWLAEHHGDDPAGWAWGRVQTASFAHQPLGMSGVAPLEKIFNSKPVPAPGWEGTVAMAGSDPETFRVGFGVSQRFVADLANLARSFAVNSTGQSSLLFHRHREDQAPLWSAGQYHPVLTGREAVGREAESTMTLSPR
ncbi:MAG TPA: penicillin acylase family protein [Thermoanaerobaculia bacterium]|nr:penicillin acylase family protein [Thermoanaerobaculia bacterium]